MLPTFIVIGAMKSGTTSLYHYLDEHPEVGMSAQKETDFFVAENSAAKMGTGSSKSRNWALLLYHLLRRFRPTSCVELGTCLGLSGAYQAAALKSNGAGLGDTAEVVAGRF
jgi:predicted O-methyltransferase YrrM